MKLEVGKMYIGNDGSWLVGQKSGSDLIKEVK